LRVRRWLELKRLMEGKVSRRALAIWDTSYNDAAKSGKEVILCGGAIDTPRLLLLNGIGPASELEELGVPVVKDLKGVGKHLQDHVWTVLAVEVDGRQNDRYALESDPDKIAVAQALYKKDQSGPFALAHSSLWGGFLKLPDLESYPEFQSLDTGMKKHLRNDKVPTYELIGNCALLPGLKCQPGNSYLSAGAFLMNPQSEGSVTLKSKDPKDSPVIDVAYLSHPYDHRVHRESIRAVWNLLFEHADTKKAIKGKLFGPESLSDEDIDAHMKNAANTVWHANGTVKMGKSDDEGACVDTRFKVFGIDGLRVADLSVCPVTTK
jgi:choline dehydrogenase-like flavoprotein